MAGMLTTTRLALSRQDFLALSPYQQKREDLRQFFEDSPGDGALKSRCIRPDHRDSNPSLLISADHAYCLGCGSFWWPDQFLAELGDRSLQAVSIESRPRAVSRYIPMAMVQTYNKWLNTHYRSRLEWLYARGLRLEDAINLNKLGYDGQAFVIPVMHGDSVQALRFRRDDLWQDDLEDTPEKPKYWGLSGRNQIALYKPRVPDWATLRSGSIFLCEGELDALRLSQEGLQAWSLTNGCRSFRYEHAEAFEGLDVMVCYDQDESGRAASQRICRMIKAKNVIWPAVLGKDVTEFLQRWSLQAFLNHL